MIRPSAGYHPQRETPSRRVAGVVTVVSCPPAGTRAGDRSADRVYCTFFYLRRVALWTRRIHTVQIDLRDWRRLDIIYMVTSIDRTTVNTEQQIRIVNGIRAQRGARANATPRDTSYVLRPRLWARRRILKSSGSENCGR